MWFDGDGVVHYSGLRSSTCFFLCEYRKEEDEQLVGTCMFLFCVCMGNNREVLQSSLRDYSNLSYAREVFHCFNQPFIILSVAATQIVHTSVLQPTPK